MPGKSPCFIDAVMKLFTCLEEVGLCIGVLKSRESVEFLRDDALLLEPLASIPRRAAIAGLRLGEVSDNSMEHEKENLKIKFGCVMLRLKFQIK